jgi:gamma-glutamyltranspeptidase/glutathione hydrolase
MINRNRGRIALNQIWKIILLCFVHIPFILPARPIDPYHYESIKRKICEKEAVVCAHPLAAQAGLLMLEKGGNAVDAAIAVQWALAVVYPGAGNIGGGGFMVASLRNNKRIALDYREKAPSLASKDMYLDSTTGKANTALSQFGHLASGIPGTPAGLYAAHRYARLPMKVLMQPAIEFAEKGFVLTASEAESLNEAKADFLKYNTAPIAFVKQQGSWQKGDTLVQKELAETLKRIRDHGLPGFYEGITAGLLAAEMKRGKGLITKKDLASYRAIERIPVAFYYKGYEVMSMPLPSSGGILLQQMLTMLEDRPLPVYGFETLKSVQLMVEVERRAYADRAQHLGDPGFYEVPVSTLVAKDYLAKRMADYDSTKAGKSENTRAGIINESNETTHISILDKEGNAVAVTTTLNGHFGSKTVVGGAGFLLNNEMDDFSIQEGVSNMYGAVGGKANAIAPGKRMLSSMTPTIVLKKHKPYIIVGTPGGTTIITSVLQSIVDVLDFKMNADETVNRPKFHHQWLPDEIQAEKGFDMNVLKGLKEMGYHITEKESIGRTEMILVQANGKYEAVADHRGDDSAAGN